MSISSRTPGPQKQPDQNPAQNQQDLDNPVNPPANKNEQENTQPAPPPNVPPKKKDNVDDEIAKKEQLEKQQKQEKVQEERKKEKERFEQAKLDFARWFYENRAGKEILAGNLIHKESGREINEILLGIKKELSDPTKNPGAITLTSGDGPKSGKGLLDEGVYLFRDISRTGLKTEYHFGVITDEKGEKRCFCIRPNPDRKYKLYLPEEEEKLKVYEMEMKILILSTGIPGVKINLGPGLSDKEAVKELLRYLHCAEKLGATIKYDENTVKEYFKKFDESYLKITDYFKHYNFKTQKDEINYNEINELLELGFNTKTKEGKEALERKVNEMFGEALDAKAYFVQQAERLKHKQKYDHAYTRGVDRNLTKELKYDEDEKRNVARITDGDSYKNAKNDAERLRILKEDTIDRLGLEDKGREEKLNDLKTEITKIEKDMKKLEDTIDTIHNRFKGYANDLENKRASKEDIAGMYQETNDVLVEVNKNYAEMQARLKGLKEVYDEEKAEMDDLQKEQDALKKKEAKDNKEEKKEEKKEEEITEETLSPPEDKKEESKQDKDPGRDVEGEKEENPDPNLGEKLKKFAALGGDFEKAHNAAKEKLKELETKKQNCFATFETVRNKVEGVPQPAPSSNRP